MRALLAIGIALLAVPPIAADPPPPADAYAVAGYHLEEGVVTGYFRGDAPNATGELWVTGDLGELHIIFTMGGSSVPISVPAGTLWIDQWSQTGRARFVGVHIEDFNGNETGVAAGGGRVEGFTLVAATHT